VTRRAGLLLALTSLLVALPAVAPAGAEAANAPAQFLTRYVDGDGRVVRHDQGGDTVSEGQAYALLVADGLGEPATFARVWSWTAQHLQRPDGLLSWHWADGHVLDPMPASDADLDAAWALALAATQFHMPSYAEQARRIAGAILAEETVEVDGAPVLVAGPWARTAPYVINPSYASPDAFVTLADSTSDARWAVLAGATLRLLRSLATPSRLPPDWATIDASGTVAAVSAPGAAEPPRYGLDAARVPIWSAAACDPAWHTVASSVRPLVARTGQRVGATLTLAGSALSDAPAPTLTVAAAAAAGAAGDRRVETALWTRAARLEARQPTYYGAAWIALGQMLLIDPTGRWCP
jgi:endo-1,4-beta-D-glucanase Y